MRDRLADVPRILQERREVFSFWQQTRKQSTSQDELFSTGLLRQTSSYKSRLADQPHLRSSGSPGGNPCVLRRSLFRACLCILDLGCAGQSTSQTKTLQRPVLQSSAYSRWAQHIASPAELWSLKFRHVVCPRLNRHADKHTRNKVANKLVPGVGVVLSATHSSRFCGTLACTKPCPEGGKTISERLKKKQIAVWLGSQPPGLRFRHHCGPKFHDVDVRITHELPDLAGGVLSLFVPWQMEAGFSTREAACVTCLRVLSGVPCDWVGI